ncbi:hypothetical protein [Gracilimonas sp.]|uniref:hypothetical protein n=1 Tax=Gracilimonas sp. TaxID=1974203 RepID=UPI0032EBF2B1
MKTTNYKMQKLLSMLTTLFGFILLVFMIVVEDEPGAIPLLLIVAGTVWFFIIRSKIKSQQIYSQ